MSLLAGAILADAYNYWKHRLFHTSLLWPWHKYHHSHRNPSALAGYAISPVFGLATFWPIALGAVPEVNYYTPMYLGFVGFYLLLNHYLHCGYVILWLEAAAGAAGDHDLRLAQHPPQPRPQRLSPARPNVWRDDRVVGPLDGDIPRRAAGREAALTGRWCMDRIIHSYFLTSQRFFHISNTKHAKTVYDSVREFVTFFFVSPRVVYSFPFGTYDYSIFEIRRHRRRRDRTARPYPCLPPRTSYRTTR